MHSLSTQSLAQDWDSVLTEYSKFNRRLGQYVLTEYTEFSTGLGQCTHRIFRV